MDCKIHPVFTVHTHPIIVGEKGNNKLLYGPPHHLNG